MIQNLFMIIKIDDKAVEYQGDLGDYGGFIADHKLTPAIPILSSSFTVDRPYQVGSRVGVATNIYDIPVGFEWFDKAPFLIGAVANSQAVDLTIFSCNTNDVKKQDEIGFKCEMIGGQISSFTVIPGFGGSPTTASMIYAAKEYTWHSATDKFAYKTGSASKR